MNKFYMVTGMAFVAILFLALFGLFTAFIVKLSVNYLLTPETLKAVFGGPLSYWKAYVLSFTTSLLFKSSVTTSGGSK